MIIDSPTERDNGFPNFIPEATKKTVPPRFCRQFSRDPRANILEHFQPGSFLAARQACRCPWLLPATEASLRMRHHGEVASIWRAHGGDTIWRAIWIERIYFRSICTIVHINKWHQARLQDLATKRFLRKKCSTLPVRNPHAQHRAVHTVEPQLGSRRRKNLHSRIP